MSREHATDAEVQDRSEPIIMASNLRGDFRITRHDRAVRALDLLDD